MVDVARVQDGVPVMEYFDGVLAVLPSLGRCQVEDFEGGPLGREMA